MNLTVEYCETTKMKGDMFTKALDTQKYVKAREMIGIVQKSGVTPS